MSGDENQEVKTNRKAGVLYTEGTLENFRQGTVVLLFSVFVL